MLASHRWFSSCGKHTGEARLLKGVKVSPIGRLALEETMIHEMPRGRRVDGSGPQIIHSNAPTPLNLKTDRFIREEMLHPSLNIARQVVEVSPAVSTVPQLVRQVLLDSTLLPNNSKLIARHMHSTQTSGSSAGVFMASVAKEDGQPRFIILKAEHQEGVRLKHSMSGSDIVFEVEHLTELIMGQNSRVYKIAMLWLNRETDQLYGLMVDKQNGSSFADYFLEEFLGCELTHRAEIQTEEFVNGLGKIANSTQFPIETRTRYATAAVAYLESPNTVINPSRFITEYIDPGDRDLVATTFLSEVQGQEFLKDITLVKNRIGGLKMKISSGVTINASSEALENGIIKFDRDAKEGPRVIIKGTPEVFEMSKPPK